MVWRAFIRALPLILLAGLWEILPRSGIINPEQLPPASAVAIAWWNLLIGGDLVTNGISSLINVSAGLGLGIVVGVLAGVLMAWYPKVDAAVSPLMKSLYPMPKSALVPVMILWFGLGAGSKIASIFMGCLLPVVLSSYNGCLLYTSVKGQDYYRDLDARPNLKALQNNIDTQRELGFLNIAIDVKAYSDLSLVDEAAKRPR